MCAVVLDCLGLFPYENNGALEMVGMTNDDRRKNLPKQTHTLDKKTIL